MERRARQEERLALPAADRVVVTPVERRARQEERPVRQEPAQQQREEQQQERNENEGGRAFDFQEILNLGDNFDFDDMDVDMF